MNKKIKIICLSVLVFLCLSVFVMPVFAQSFDNPIPALKKIEQQHKDNPAEVLPFLAGGLIQKVLGFLGIVALILVLYAGFLRMLSQGDAEKIKTSNNIMLYAVIGIFIVFASYAMLKFVFKIIQ